MAKSQRYVFVIQDHSGKVLVKSHVENQNPTVLLNNLHEGLYRLIRYSPRAIMMQTVEKRTRGMR